MKKIDTHSHFNLSQFNDDREEAIARMETAGVGTICIGIDEATSVLATEIAKEHDGIWSCVGQHPTEWAQTFEAEKFQALIDNVANKVVAIGECGLDYYREEERTHKAEQEKVFRQQIELAIENNLPLMLHIRPEQGNMDAYDDAIAILRGSGTIDGNKKLLGTAHFFAGDERIAQAFIDMGFYISFSGVITFASAYESVVQFVPINRILSETDAPFAAPAPYRGHRNEPAYVVEVVKKIAEIKGLPLEEVEKQLVQNAKTLFSL